MINLLIGMLWGAAMARAACGHADGAALAGLFAFNAIAVCTAHFGGRHIERTRTD